MKVERQREKKRGEGKREREREEGQNKEREKERSVERRVKPMIRWNEVFIYTCERKRRRREKRLTKERGKDERT
ncbi:hypothetical protein PUN28_011770 [Cardiocondyla obscurior]|uniref:Uncharacterized protein n=1 Tax=Cardiocondyla obscurior TaxID=286306 RepID=A0AAW2FK20_9HYME